MFGISTKEEQSAQIDTTKLGVPTSLVRATQTLKNGRVQGIDSNLTAYLYVEERHGWYALGIQVETTFSGSFFTERHDIVVETTEEVFQFFGQYHLGEITWIQDSKELVDKNVVEENKTLKKEVANLRKEINDLEEENFKLREINKKIQKEMIAQAAKATAFETILKA